MVCRVFAGRDIVILGCEWNLLWQGPQEIATRFANAGNRVFYVENLGIRAPRWSDAGRVVSRLGRWIRSRRRVESRGNEQLRIFTPLVAPPFGSRLRRAFNRLLLRRITSAARAFGIRDPIIISYLPTDTAADLIALLRGPHSVLVLYYATDFSQHAQRTAALQRSEERLLPTADVVIAQERALGEHCAQWSSNVHVLPHGVSLEAFPLGDVPTDRFDRPPVIGYVGGLHKAFDDALMREVVARRRDWSWEFVGSVQIDRGLVPTGPNVRLLGARPHSELIEHLRRFDVCIIPYRENEFTAMVVPTKLNEYLAAGKAVVSTRIPAVVEFNRQHGIVQIAEASAGSFIEAIERALRDAHDPAERRRRREVAALSDWSERMESIARLIEEVER